MNSMAFISEKNKSRLTGSAKVSSFKAYINSIRSLALDESTHFAK